MGRCASSPRCSSRFARKIPGSFSWRKLCRPDAAPSARRSRKANCSPRLPMNHRSPAQTGSRRSPGRQPTSRAPPSFGRGVQSRRGQSERLEKLTALSNVPAVEYEKARSEVNRLRGLLESERIERDRNLAMLEDTSKKLEAQMKNSEIRSPMDGLLTASRPLMANSSRIAPSCSRFHRARIMSAERWTKKTSAK